ncbi:MAG: SulP family inorganic anion transporter [Aquabacterium sp.]|nr:SulP family inorganic anion transporter [Aquabacterium sp.]
MMLSSAAPNKRATVPSVLALGLAQAPETLAYGLLALAPLGAAFGPQAMGLALASAVLANVVAALAGGGRVISAPRAAMALLCGAMVGVLVSHRGPAGALTLAHVLALLAGALAAAGALQMLFGLLRLGEIVKFTPHPVRLGLSSGVGLLLALHAVPVVLGQGFGTPLPGSLALASPGAIGVALAALVVLLGAEHLRRRGRRLLLPPALWALAAGTLVQLALYRLGGVPGPLVGVPALPPPWFLQAGGATASGPWLPPSLAMPLVLFSITVAVLGVLDTLLASSVVDGRLRQSGDASRALRAQGLAALVAGALCSMPVSASVQRSLALLDAAPGWKQGVLAYALALLAWLLLAPQALGWLPLSAIGAVLLAQGLQSVDPWLWRAPLAQVLSRPGTTPLDAAQRRLLAANWGVALAVAVSSLVLGLAAAVALGAAGAVLLFVRANMRPVVRSQHSGAVRRSLKYRGQRQVALLQAEGHRIVVLELQGALFFGTADALRVCLSRLPEATDTAVLDLCLVGEIDATGARILLETGEDWARRGKALVAAEWPPDDPRRRTIEAIAGAGGLPPLRFASDTDAALEAAEERLLLRTDQPTLVVQALTLGDTQLGEGLSAAELAALAAVLEPVQYLQGEPIFRAGDVADAMLVSLQGHIGVHLPGGLRRLASFAPGTMLGEMAVLEGGVRSADVVAETAVQALRLPLQALRRLEQQQPQLANRLHANIARHLATRLRVMTRELAVWTTRHAPTPLPGAFLPAGPPPDRIDGV